MDDEPVWFTGAEPRNDAEACYLATVRELAPSWDVAGLRPEQTSVLTVLTPLLLTVQLVGLPADVALQVGYWFDPPRGPGLEGEWGDRYLLDAHLDGADGLTVFGLTAAPEEFAAWTADWLLAQLRRPVERLDWADPDGRVTASQWRLADTGLPLTREGRRSWRRRRRPPDRVERVR
ncbi:hypothetical protein [Modestobacter sp. SSW1-42]|uniref:hypothetical protein n=1 Tax=Modestobacter sp. SSW1-42 TaxID=596372 RepID=UPI003986450F